MSKVSYRRRPDDLLQAEACSKAHKSHTQRVWGIHWDLGWKVTSPDLIVPGDFLVTQDGYMFQV